MEETNITPENILEEKNKVEHSGDPHEYILGKHIKDWEGKGIAIINGEVIELDEKQMEAIRKGSISNGSGN